MPSVLSHPGVYIEEVPGGVRTIAGVATSIAAFVGRAPRGPVNTPVRVQSFAEYTRLFGGLWAPSRMSYAVSQLFLHGGCDALVVRAFNGDVDNSRATITLAASGGNLVLHAVSPGLWGERLRATVDHDTPDTADTALFNILIEELDRVGGDTAVVSEPFQNVSADPASHRYVETVLRQNSALVGVHSSTIAGERPGEATVAAAGNPSDGCALTDAQIKGDRNDRSGMFALESADIFNLLCLPPLTEELDIDAATWAAAAAYCQERRAVLIVDPPHAWTAKASSAISEAASGVDGLRGTIGNDGAGNAVAYFPRLKMPDPLAGERLASFPPCGAVAGIIARTDARSGVWTAPAGLQASFSGTQGFTFALTDAHSSLLNKVGLNCLRSFPATGDLVWGARTLAGADLLASEWKYVPVRRLALFLEESLDRGTEWVVFEPNGEPLWAQIRLEIGAFMQNLFRQGAFRGSNPSDAYFVKCDGETTTQTDIDRGIVNFIVGFAPIKPAEFILLAFQKTQAHPTPKVGQCAS